MSARLIHGDVREVLATLDDNSVDAIVTDPPYELGFMGRSWDRSGIAYSVEMWSEALRVLEPGGHLLAFGGTRTYHRMACAIEDAGFEIRDCLQWLYGSGFPKSLDVSKAIDKAAGAEREVVGVTTHPDGNPRSVVSRDTGVHEGGHRLNGVGLPVTAPATPDAERWQGWGTALKPSNEPIVHAQKPLNPVPSFDTLLTESVLYMEALLWWLSPAKCVEQCSTSSQSDCGEAPSGSVRWTAAALHMLASIEPSDMTAIFRSPEEASTYWNIGTLWSNILDALSDETSMSTTSTVSSLTTALPILNSLVSAITPANIIQAAFRHDGLWSHADTAASNSSGNDHGWNDIPKPSVVEPVSSPTVAAIVNMLASIADSLSLHRRATSDGSVRRHAPTGTQTTNVVSPNPANEPILLARKPLSERNVAANVLRWGTGALNIDGCRIGTTRGVPASHSTTRNTISATGYNPAGRDPDELNPNIGRWPANVILDECAAEVLDASTEPSQSRIGTPRASAAPGNGWRMTHSGAEYDDAGGPSRFFYVAKASREERNRGLDALDERPLLWSAGTQNPGSFQSPNTNRAARNHHPTVKPIELMQYLCRLVTPPGGTVLDPFAGSGPTLIAALREGFSAIGIDRESEYIELARRRIVGDAPLLNVVEVI